MNSTTSFFNARFSYCMVFITSFFFAAFYLQTFFYLILALLIALPFFSYNLSKYVFMQIGISLSFSSPICVKGGECLLELNINNPTHLPLSEFEITVTVKSLFYGGGRPEVHSLQLRPGNNRLSFPVSFNKYGVYTAIVSDPKACDYFHLFSFARDFTGESSLTIMPEVEPREQRHEAIYEEGFDEFTDTVRRGNASSNVTDIREYQPGDRLSRIHWKLTEKLDKLIVKENEATSSNEFIVLLELYQPSKDTCDKVFADSGYEDDSMYHILDDAVEEAWAVSIELLLAGETFLFMFYNLSSEEFTSLLIHSKEELNDIFTRAFYAGCYDTSDLALSVYERAGMNKGTLIHVK